MENQHIYTYEMKGPNSCNSKFKVYFLFKDYRGANSGIKV